MLLLVMFVEWLGLDGAGLLSPSGVNAGGVGMLMIAVVIWEALQFGLRPSSDFIFRLERLEDQINKHKSWFVFKYERSRNEKTRVAVHTKVWIFEYMPLYKRN